MNIEPSHHGQFLLMAARVAIISRQGGKRVVRVTVLRSARLAEPQEALAQEIQDQIEERFARWVDGRLAASSNNSAANLRVRLGPQGLSFQVTSPKHSALADEHGAISTAADAAWIIRDNLRRLWPAHSVLQKECQL